MQTLTNGYRGLSLLVDLNRDRLMAIGTIIVALSVGALIGSFL